MAIADAYNDLLATTLDNYRGKLVDNIFNKHVLSWLLMDNNRTRMEAGGEQIVEHLLVGENTDASEYSEWDSVPITPQGGVDVAKFDWKQLISTIAISGLEEFKNQGEARIINLLKARVMQSEKTLQKMVNDQLWGVDATGFNSVLDLIDDGQDGVGRAGGVTVGGIDRSVAGNAFFRSPVVDATGRTTGEQYLQDFVNAYNSSSDGNEAVTAAVTNQDNWETYMLHLTPQVRYTDKRSAGLGFKNVEIMGVPLYWDKAAPAGVTVGINPDSLTLVGGKDRWFKQSPFTKNPIDQAAAGGAEFRDARYAVITAYGNVTTNQPRRNFKIIGFGL